MLRAQPFTRTTALPSMKGIIFLKFLMLKNKIIALISIPSNSKWTRKKCVPVTRIF